MELLTAWCFDDLEQVLIAATGWYVHQACLSKRQHFTASPAHLQLLRSYKFIPICVITLLYLLFTLQKSSTKWTSFLTFYLKNQTWQKLHTEIFRITNEILNFQKWVLCYINISKMVKHKIYRKIKYNILIMRDLTWSIIFHSYDHLEFAF